MSVLSPSDSPNVDQTRVHTPPPPMAPVAHGGVSEFFDEPKNRLFVGAVGLAVLLLVGVAAFIMATRGGSDEVATAPNLLTETEPADSVVADGSGTEAGAGEASGAAAPSLPELADTSAAIPPTTAAPTTAAPTTPVPTTARPTTAAAATEAPTTAAPVTEAPTTAAPVTEAPTTAAPVTEAPTTAAPATAAPETKPPATAAPATNPPATAAPTTDPPATAAPATAAPSGGGSAAQQILNLTNNERAKAGCGPLSLNAQLNSASQAHSEDMRANNYFDHTGLNGSKPWDRARAAGYGSSSIGENIAAGYGSAEAVMNGWMNSPGHRANILNCSYNHLGVGLSSQGNYWTQLFGGG